MLEQEITHIDTGRLVEEAKKLFQGGYRLVHICAATMPENIELTYSFDKDFHYVTLRLVVTPSDTVPSISGVYFSAFLYENEMHDLYGINITGIAIDYQGKFYRTTVKWPFQSTPTSPNKVG